MRLALIGYGAMGKLVENLAGAAGDEIGLKVDSRDASLDATQLAASLRGHDAAIDFSVGPAVLRNIDACGRAGVPLVEGTTGWQEKVADARRLMEDHQGALVYGANFSIGVKLKDLMSEYVKTEIPIASVRAGHIPGTHRVGFDSTADQIMLTHMARSREGFAAGALLAARWITGRKGIYEFSEVLNEVMSDEF
jgi:4-hydroxy-tetrahydrodipicolinate reductase